MALTDCLATALEGGEITKSQHDRLRADYERIRARHGMTGAAAEAAKAELLDRLKKELVHKKRQAKLAIAKTREILTDFDAYRTAGGGKDVAEAGLFKLSNNGEARFDSVERRTDVVVGMAHAMMEDLLDRFRRSRLLGDARRHNRAQLDNVVREAFGEDSGDAAARDFARAWTDTAEWLRQRFNAAGGAINKLENWGLPQWHDARALLHRTLPVWKADIRELLDVGRMVHPLTGMPVLEEELDGILDGIWEGIVTGGWDTREPTRSVFGKGALANQRAEHRFLVFKNADAWMKYQADYGGGSDPFGAMMGHIDMMARDIAAMEILGPNPGTMIEFIKQVITKEAALRSAGKESRFGGMGRPADRANHMNHRIDAVWGSIRGTLNTPVNGLWANVGAGARNLITASVMGSAALSSISDVGTQLISRTFAGLAPGHPFLETIRAAAGGTSQREAIAAGLILDQARHVHAAQARYVGTVNGRGWTAYLADRVLTLSGLTPWTQGGRHAFGLAFMHEAGKQMGKSFDQLHPLFRSKFQQYGIDAAAWDTIRRAELHKSEDGLEILRPREIAGRNRQLGERYLSMILSETEFAVPSGNHRSRTILVDQNQPGTLPGELLRSFAQFKSFGAVYAMLHGGLIARRIIGRQYGQAATYAGALLLTSGFFGAMAMQLKNVASGRDPQPMTSPQFWAAAFLQGGGLGLYGDFFFSDLNRYGGGLAGSVGGPTAERIGGLTNLTIGNLAELAAGKDTKFVKELVQFARGNVPGGNLWFTRLAWERVVLDQLQWLADPNAARAFRDKQRRYARDFQTGYWWAPGTAAPQRAPNAMNAIASPAEGG